MLPHVLLLFSCTLSGIYASLIANQYFDNVLNIPLQNELRTLRLDPAPIPDFTTEFKDKVAFINVKGQANYTDGNLTGLSLSRRYYECMGPSYSFGSILVNCTISFNDLKTTYSGKVKYGQLPVVSIKAKTNVTETLIFVEVTGSPPNNIPVIKNLYVTALGRIEPVYTGLGPLNKQLKFLEAGYKTHVTTEIYAAIQQRFSYAFGKAVTQVPLPRL